MKVERLTVKVGIGECVGRKMTRDEAKRYGRRHMPKDLKASGFEVFVFQSDPEIHGSSYLRINYGKHVGT